VADVVARNVRFHVQRMGEGAPTVVFLHGLVMDNLSSWYFTVANHVAKQSSVLLYDLRGHGRSERTPTGYSVPDMVSDLDALLQAECPEQRVVLVGNSFGGLLALAFAVEHPERIESLVLVDAHWSDEGWADKMVSTLALQGTERDEKIADAFQHWLGRHSERKRNRLAQNAEQLVYGTSLLSDLQNSPVCSAEQLSTVSVPVLALYGDESDIRDRGSRLADLLPQCTLEWLPQCTHSILWEATETIRERIVDWIETFRRASS